MTDDPARRRTVIRLGILFGGMYVIQGLVEPGYGITKQPQQSLLDQAGFSDSEITSFGGWLGLPWMFKPLYGLLSDFVPIFGYRRLSWLIVMAAVTSIGFGVAALFPSIRDSYGGLLAWLLVANTAVAFTDVVVDAAMVETGQPLGLTGRLQSIQWSSVFAASIVAGWAGGWLAAWQRADAGFLFCAIVSTGTAALAWWGLKERRFAVPAQSLGSVLRSFGRAARSRTILLAGGFLLLWNFNPFADDVLYLYLGDELKFDEPFRGHLRSVSAMSQMAASLAYGFYCTRVRFPILVHASIVLGILATIGYWGLEGSRSAVAVTIATGFVYQTATMIQLDLSARVCPPQIAGTMFALLMALSNFGMSMSAIVGGKWYERWTGVWDRPTAFNLLVGTGAAFTAACWLITPWLLRAARSVEEPA